MMNDKDKNSPVILLHHHHHHHHHLPTFKKKNSNNQLFIPVDSISLYHHHLNNSDLSKYLQHAWNSISKNSSSSLFLRVDPIKGIHFSNQPEFHHSALSNLNQQENLVPNFLPKSISPNQLVKIIIIKKFQHITNEDQDKKINWNSKINATHRHDEHTIEKLVEYQIKIIYRNRLIKNQDLEKQHKSQVIVISSDDDEDESYKKRIKAKLKSLENRTSASSNHENYDDDKTNVSKFIKSENDSDNTIDRSSIKNRTSFEISCNLNLSYPNKQSITSFRTDNEIEKTCDNLNQFIERFKLDQTQLFHDLHNFPNDQIDSIDTRKYYFESKFGETSQFTRHVNNYILANEVEVQIDKNLKNKNKQIIQIEESDQVTLIRSPIISNPRNYGKKIIYHTPERQAEDDEVDDEEENEDRDNDGEPNPKNTQKREKEESGSAISERNLNSVDKMNSRSNRVRIKKIRNTNFNTTSSTSPILFTKSSGSKSNRVDFKIKVGDESRNQELRYNKNNFKPNPINEINPRAPSYKSPSQEEICDQSSISITRSVRHVIPNQADVGSLSLSSNNEDALLVATLLNHDNHESTISLLKDEIKSDNVIRRFSFNKNLSSDFHPNTSKASIPFPISTSTPSLSPPPTLSPNPNKDLNEKNVRLDSFHDSGVFQMQPIGMEDSIMLDNDMTMINKEKINNKNRFLENQEKEETDRFISDISVPPQRPSEKEDEGRLTLRTMLIFPGTPDEEGHETMTIPTFSISSEVAADPMNVPISTKVYQNERNSIPCGTMQKQATRIEQDIISEVLKDLDSDPEDENYRPRSIKPMNLNESDDDDDGGGDDDDDDTSNYTTDDEDSDLDSLNSFNLKQTAPVHESNQTTSHSNQVENQRHRLSMHSPGIDQHGLTLKNFFLEDYCLKAKKQNERLKKKYRDLKYKINQINHYNGNDHDDDNEGNNKNKKIKIHHLIQEKRLKKKLNKKIHSINILKSRLRKKDEKICEYQVNYQMEINRLEEEIKIVEENINSNSNHYHGITNEHQEEKEIERQKLKKMIKLLILIQDDQSCFINQLENQITCLETQIKNLENSLFPI